MPAPAPPIDRRSVHDFVRQTEELLQRYSGWSPPPAGDDPGRALVHIFARLAELVVDRLNQVPDRNFLAFLDLLGLELLPPQPARVPLTFFLAPGTPSERIVPPRTPVAALPLPGDTGTVTFETVQPLVVTPYALSAALTREPERDRYADHTAAASGAAGASFAPFSGTQRVQRRLYLGHAAYLRAEEEKRAAVRFLPHDPRWQHLLEWSYLKEGVWHAAPVSQVASAGTPEGPALEVTLSPLPGIPPEAVTGRVSSWLRADLKMPLRDRGIAPEAAFADAVSLDLTDTFHPFGRQEPRTSFHLAFEPVPLLSSVGAALEIEVELDPDAPARPSQDLQLVWEYRGAGEWRPLGTSTPASASLGEETTGFADGTLAFTRSGTVRFQAPAGWVAGEANGRSAPWLRVRIGQGGYGGGVDHAPPAVRRVSLSYDVPAPTVDAVRVGVGMQRTGLVPRLAFANQLPLDLSKDFLPFGERPRPGDTLYLGVDEVSGKPGARISLEVKLTNPSTETGTPPPARASADLRLRWEFWSEASQRWERLGDSASTGAAPASPYAFSDASRAFTVEGSIAFDAPVGMGATEVGGERAHWLRARITSGNYGVEGFQRRMTRADGTQVNYPNSDIPVYEYVPASFRPPSVLSLRQAYVYASPFVAPEFTLAENDFAVTDHGVAAALPGESFTPFLPPPDSRPTLYLGFRRPGAEPAAGETGFANRPTTLYVGVEEAWYSPRARAAAPRDAEAADVAWEYWNGTDWVRLGVLDETRGFTRRGLVSFVAPPDFRLHTEFGQAAFWLRARHERGEYGHDPRLTRVLTNTTWATHTLSVDNEVLGSSNGQHDQAFLTSRAPVLPGQALEVREPEIPSAAERAAILAEEGPDAIRTVNDAAGRAVEVWVRWHPVPDFFGSGPRSRHYVLDRLTGEVRFGDGQLGLVPPQGRANLRMTLYRTGGGAQGNRPAGNVAQLKTTIPNIARVVNPEPAAGGAAGETLEAVRTRGPRTLRHRDRAVTAADYEDLAMEVSPDIARVRSIAARDDRDAGKVTLILVPRSRSVQPNPSLELIGRVEDHLRARLPATAEVEVHGPRWLKVSVQAEVVPLSQETATEVQAAVLARLEAFLHPLTGGLDGEGWEFGRKPYRSDLHALIGGTPGVDHVRRLIVEEEGTAQGDAFLVYSGLHRVSVVGASGD